MNEYYEYNKKFRRETYKIFNFYLSKEKDKDIIDYMDTLSNKNEFLKSLIRNQINNRK